MASFHYIELYSHTTSQNRQFVQWTYVKQQPNSSQGGHCVHLSRNEQTLAAVTTEKTQQEHREQWHLRHLSHDVDAGFTEQEK